MTRSALSPTFSSSIHFNERERHFLNCSPENIGSNLVYGSIDSFCKCGKCDRYSTASSSTPLHRKHKVSKLEQNGALARAFSPITVTLNPDWYTRTSSSVKLGQPLLNAIILALNSMYRNVSVNDFSEVLLAKALKSDTCSSVTLKSSFLTRAANGLDRSCGRGKRSEWEL